ncbi:MAG: PEGA domain-containing protein [Polyangiaceae bacterium]|nr:PEGA domain-containing protein [Polyangiaceae bacterium]
MSPSQSSHLAFSVLLLFVASVARAQQPAVSSAATAPAVSPSTAGARAEDTSEPPSASTPTQGPAAATSPRRGADTQYRAAQQYFDRGVAFFEAENFEAALTEFERAYDRLQGHPKRFFVLDNIGQCHERLFRYDRALEYYHRYLAEGGPSAEDRETVEGVIRTLEGLLATVVIRSNVPAEVWLGDRQMGEAPGRVLIPGGRHVIELRARGYESAKKEISIAARETQEHSFGLQELREGISPLYFYGGAVLTAGAIVGGAYFGMKARSEHDEGIRRRDEIGAIANTTEDEDRVKRYAVTADVCFASGIVLGVGTTLLYFMTGWGSREQDPAATPVDAAVGPDSLALSLRGVF